MEKRYILPIVFEIFLRFTICFYGKKQLDINHIPALRTATTAISS